MTNETRGMSGPLLTEYASIPIVFEVASVLSARESSPGRFLLAEHVVDPPYIKLRRD
jgi:hypothetical protein